MKLYTLHAPKVYSDTRRYPLWLRVMSPVEHSQRYRELAYNTVDIIWVHSCLQQHTSRYQSCRSYLQ